MRRSAAGFGRRLVEGIPVVVWALLSLRLLLYTDAYAPTLFVQDQWDYLSGHLDGAGWLDLFRLQHGPHRQGVGGWLLVPVLRASDFDGVAIARLTAACLVAAALAALLLRRRLSGPLGVIDAAIPLLLLGLGQFQTLVGVANPSHSALPLLLAMLCGLAFTLDDLRTRLVSLLLLDLLAVYTGFGLFLGVVIPSLLALEIARAGPDDRGRGARVAALVASLAILASFFVGWDASIATGRCSADEVLAAAGAWGLPFGRIVGSGLGTPGRVLSWVLLLGVAGVGLTALRGRRPEAHPPADRVILMFAGLSLLFVASVAVGRACVSERALYASRYATLAAPGLLAVFLAAQRWPRIRGVALLPALLCIGLVAAEARPKPKDARSIETILARRVAFSVCLIDGGEPRRCSRELGWRPHPDPGVLTPKLEALRRDRRNVFSERGRNRVELRATR